MAQENYVLTGEVSRFITHLDTAITQGSATAKLEGSAERRIGDARMVVRVYERYSTLGGNRVSLSVSVLAVGQQMEVSVITSGGSTAMFWKVNTFGEDAFLKRAEDAIRRYSL
jgi:hypothetical protein